MAKGRYHNLVKEILEKDGWTITHDPYPIEIEGFLTLKVDLGTERVLAAERGNEKIAVEIKTFPSVSQITDFYQALGQFNFYAVMLEEKDPQRTLFLAIPATVRKTFFEQSAVKSVMNEYKVRSFVYDTDKKQITEWTK